MTFNEYQAFTKTTAKYHDIFWRHFGKESHSEYLYGALGLNGEAGEVADKVKKLYRDRDGVVDEQFKDEMKKELGDVLWYVARMADDFGFTLEEVVEANVEKLNSRKDRGKLHGDGDNR
jgi:NTP pyrophosphatase (non-canonical NTP hydrolase)